MDKMIENKSMELLSGAYDAIPDEIKNMSHDQLAIFLHMVIKTFEHEESKNKSLCPISREDCCKSDVPVLAGLFVGIENYKLVMDKMSFLYDLYNKMDGRDKTNGGIGNLYAIEFDDGHVKIGKSMRPLARIKSVSASNQAKMLRQWVSGAVNNYTSIEREAHSAFADFRVGGEFFKVPFSDVVNWLSSRIGEPLQVLQ